MVRTDDDSWDITESVGATALSVAAARAAETASDRPLFHDPFARMFLDAAGEGPWSMFDRLADDDVEPELQAHVHTMRDFFAARTAFIDDYFTAASAEGIRQVVILAAGLDARAWRLDWPTGTRVFELDQPRVLDFKSATLRAHGAVPTAERFEVAVDLRHDWPEVLRRAGFDERAPTAWSVEGLLRYLPALAQDLLFERIHGLSAVGSRVVANAPTEEARDPARERDVGRRVREALSAKTGIVVVDSGELAYAEARTDPVHWFTEHRWEASATTVPEAVARYRGGDVGEKSSVPSFFITGRRAR